MELVLSFTLAISIALVVFQLKRTKDYVNPSVLTAVFFVLPLIANRLQLSGLNVDLWLDETYLVIIYFLVIFIIIPSVVVLSMNENYTILKRDDLYTKIHINNKFLVFMILFSISTQFYINKASSDYFLPVLNIHNIDVIYHTVNIAVVGIVFIMSWYLTVILVYIRSRQTNNILYYVVFLVILCIPLTRLARFDIINALFMVVLFGIVTSKKPGNLIIKLSVWGALLSIFGAMVATYRWSQAGVYDVSFSQEIDFKVYSGPMEVFSFLYAYFPLSFENIDRFIIKNIDNWDYAYGAFMSRPIAVGLLKLHYLEGFPFTQHFEEMRDPLTGVATVSTVIPAFTVDFGVYFSFIPMILYSGIGLFLYLRCKKNTYAYMLYLFYATSYAMSSFQNTFIQPNFVYFLILYILAVKMKVIRYRVIRYRVK